MVRAVAVAPDGPDHTYQQSRAHRQGLAMVATGLESHQQPLTPCNNPPPDLRPMTLTFLLTDVEGSTRLWEAHHEAMERALARHDRLVSQAVAHHGGRLVKAKVRATAPSASSTARHRRSPPPWSCNEAAMCCQGVVVLGLS